jgi:hypothetical protein
LSADQGQGLLSAGTQRVAFQSIASPTEHYLVTSSPAELAGYAETGDTDTDQSYVDLGFADDTSQGGDGDEFGSAGPDDHIELDAA